MMTDGADLMLVWCNCAPNEAVELARALVTRKVASCVNVLPGVQSVYRWQGEICEEVETTLLIKTSGDMLDKVQAVLDELHSYDVPEIVAVSADRVNASYATWHVQQLQ